MPRLQLWLPATIGADKCQSIHSLGCASDTGENSWLCCPLFVQPSQDTDFVAERTCFL